MQKLFVTTLFGICVLAALIFYLNTIALEYYLYWTYWWYDIVMHFLGGVLVAAMVVWVLTRFNFLPKQTRYSSFMWTLLFVLLVGASWEVFEYVNGFFIGEANIVADTALDLVMDVTGGVVSWLVLAPILKAYLQSAEPTPPIV